MTDSYNQESSRDIDYTHCIWTQHQRLRVFAYDNISNRIS